MKITIVSVHLPEPDGTAAGRALHALSTGFLEEGHELTVQSWRPQPPVGPLPAWCHWTPLPTEARWRTRARALLRPRSDVVVAEWDFGGQDHVIADDPLSYPAVARASHPSVTFHYSARLDARAVGGRAPADLQDARAERRIAASAPRVVAYSARVASILGHQARPVPIAFAAPAGSFPEVAEPVAACVGDWLWPPNRRALDVLLAAWPSVHAARPQAVLRLAGRGLEAVGAMAGVEVLGPVERSEDVLAGAAVVAFPCPPSSGPKVKVLEAIAGARTVVTTEAGVEGLCPGAHPGAVITDADPEAFAAGLGRVLGDPLAGRQAALEARSAIIAVHSPRPAARTRLQVLA